MTTYDDKNLKHRIAYFTVDGTEYGIYLINPKESFIGFGGSRHSLTPKKTASLIVRRLDAMGLEDIEYDISDKTGWDWIFRCAAAASYSPPFVKVAA